MAKAITINVIYLGIILPVILLAVNKNNQKWQKGIVWVGLYFVVYKIILLAPSYFSWLLIDGLSWNWTGKILAILFSLFFYYKFKPDLGQGLYINLKPERKYLKLSIIILGLVSAISIIEGILFYNQKWDTETLLFQLTLPGIDEEIAYRGIILGLFSSIMLEKISFGKIVIHHPAIWIVGILFGLIHALQFNDHWNLTFNLLYFIKTFLLGTIWGYMTIKTRSILMPILSHNLSNTLANVIGMLK